MPKSTAGGLHVEGYDRQKTSAAGSTDVTPFHKPWLFYAAPIPAWPSIGAAGSAVADKCVMEALAHMQLMQ